MHRALIQSIVAFIKFAADVRLLSYADGADHVLYQSGSAANPNRAGEISTSLKESLERGLCLRYTSVEIFKGQCHHLILHHIKLLLQVLNKTVVVGHIVVCCSITFRMAPSAVEAPVPAAKAIDSTNGFIMDDELKSPASPLPEVKIFNAASATVEDLVEAIRVAGGVVIRNVLDQDELARIERDTRPELEKDTAWGDGMFSNVPGNLITSISAALIQMYL